jgi:hypothetical protein
MSRLNTREIQEFKNSCKVNSTVDYVYNGQSGSGRVKEVEYFGGVKIQGVLSHLISDHGLSAGMYSSLVVDGKRII